MIFNNLEFHAMQSSLDALWMKQKVITNNIANVETPGFKAKQVTFGDMLESERNKGKAGGADYSFQAVVNEDLAASARPDGNNVNSDKENLELYNTYLQTVTLYQKISGQITDFRYVLANAFK